MVVKGYVKRYLILDNGSLGVQIIYGPQDMFSLTKTYDLLLGQSIYDGPEVYYYETMTDTQLYTLDAESFAQAVQKNPLLYKELFSEAGQHLKTCVHRIENISLGSTYVRVAHELLFCAKRFGIASPWGVKLTLPLTHQDIANIVGITRETVTKAIIRLRQDGLISDSRRISILDLKGLEQTAYHPESSAEKP